MTMNERMRDLRIRAGLRQEDVAALIGITRAGYQQIEGGRNGKKLAYLPRLAKALGCRIDDLFPEMDDACAGAEKNELDELAM